MENWMLFAFLAPLFWGCNNVMSKFLIDKHLKNPCVFNAYYGIACFALVVPVALYSGLSFDPFLVAVALACGLLNFAQNLLYLMALKVEEASRIVPLTFLYAAFASFFAFLLLGETVTAVQYAGAALLILGSVLVSLRGSLRSIAVSPALKLMIISDIMVGFTVVMEKFALAGISPYSLLFWMGIGQALAGVVIILASKQNKTDFAAALKLPLKTGGILWLDAACSTVAMLFFLAALSGGPATLVSSLNAVQPFFTLVLIFLLSRFLPHILKEDFTRGTLLLKIIAVLAVFAGVYLLAG